MKGRRWWLLFSSWNKWRNQTVCGKRDEIIGYEAIWNQTVLFENFLIWQGNTQRSFIALKTILNGHSFLILALHKMIVYKNPNHKNTHANYS